MNNILFYAYNKSFLRWKYSNACTAMHSKATTGILFGIVTQVPMEHMT